MMVHFELQKKIFKSCNLLGSFFLISLCISLLYLYLISLNRVVIRPVIGFDFEPSNSLLSSSESNDHYSAGENTDDCNIVDVKWVSDETYPLYDSKDCLFVEQGFRCAENGRPDHDYPKWRWEPNNCNLPRDADVLVFNSGHWWTNIKTVRRGVFFQEGDQIWMNMSVGSAFERAMETLVDWVGREVNMSKTHVFFRTFAPHHFGAGDERNGGTCDMETLPDFSTSFLRDVWPHYKIASSVLRPSSNSSQMAMKFSLLNVTYMTGQRKDGHCSLYNHNMVPYYKRRKTPPKHKQDCLHWCLSGVPDIWNELLRAILLR